MITALVPTHNCEATIRDCLESVKWVDKIFVVDSFSTDRTLAICREYTDWIVQHEYVNSATQKNWAMGQIETEWTLQLDSDELLEPALQAEIQANLAAAQQPDAYRFKFRNMMWGKWTRMLDNEQIRVFKTAEGRWSDREVHARLLGPKIVKLLDNHVRHADLVDLSTELQQFAKQVVVWESNQYLKEGRRWQWWNVTLRPIALFFIYYFGHGGIKDGFRGFYLSAYHAFYSFMVYTRLYELEIKRGLRE